jgi:hypothetical protein
MAKDSNPDTTRQTSCWTGEPTGYNLVDHLNPGGADKVNPADQSQCQQTSLLYKRTKELLINIQKK